jgi:protein-L-isoaspartate(D-aspartate) O-methyltransferase
MLDDYRHKGLRKKLIETLKEKDKESKILNSKVLLAMGEIPRHFFIGESALLIHAYEDKAFPIGEGQTISRPLTVATQTSLLELKANDRVLEIGTGSGYQTAVLVKLGAKVFTIERQRNLFLKTREFLPSIGYNAKFLYGDGYLGNESFAPYDKIIVTAGAPFIPEALKKQLKPGGILVIPVGDDDKQIMYRLRKTTDDLFETKEYGKFGFVPMLENKT